MNYLVFQRLITSTKDIVQSFTESKIIHNEKQLENQKIEVEETLKMVALRLKNDAKQSFSVCLFKLFNND